MRNWIEFGMGKFNNCQKKTRSQAEKTELEKTVLKTMHKTLN